MSESPVATNILCPQCGAPLIVEQESALVTCGSCGATSFVDKSRAVFHYTARNTLEQRTSLSALRRWMASNATVKHLDRDAKIERARFEYFPMWLVRAHTDKGERVVLRPAAALAVSDLERFPLPAADLVPFSPESSARVVDPTVSHDTVIEWLAADHAVAREGVREVSLVHVPIFVYRYTYDGSRYTAIVDGATGSVYANLYPSKWEAPYQAVGVVAFLAYLVLGLYSLGGGLQLYAVGSVVLAIPIFLLALAISAKV